MKKLQKFFNFYKIPFLLSIFSLMCVTGVHFCYNYHLCLDDFFFVLALNAITFFLFSFRSFFFKKELELEKRKIKKKSENFDKIHLVSAFLIFIIGFLDTEAIAVPMYNEAGEVIGDNGLPASILKKNINVNLPIIVKNVTFNREVIVKSLPIIVQGDNTSNHILVHENSIDLKILESTPISRAAQNSVSPFSNMVEKDLMLKKKKFSIFYSINI